MPVRWRPMTGRHQRLMVALALAALALTLVLAVLGVAAAFAYASPVLLLLLPLLGGRYIGAERLERAIRRGRRSVPRRRSVVALAWRGPDRAALPRGGRLIGFSLAVRPPPASATA
jgi:hypothetical protein